MNFGNDIEDQEIHIELKYCERCGGLWLRLQGAVGVYCSNCRQHIAAMPDPGEAPPRKARRRHKARRQGTDAKDAQRGDLETPARIEYLEGVAVMEVSA